MIAVAAKHPNVYIDTSAHLPKYYPPQFTHFLRTYGRHKCIWASDWPILTFEAAMDGSGRAGTEPRGRAAVPARQRRDGVRAEP